MVDIGSLLRSSRDEKRVLRIVYGDRWRPIVERDIEVYAFDEKYVDAYCRLRQDPRCFRIDRIRGASLLAERFHVEPEIEALVSAHGWAHRSPEWRRERIQAVLADARIDRHVLDELRGPR